MTKKNYRNILVITVLSLMLGLGQVFAQSTVSGGINGKVVDPQGAVIPNATVTITNTGTNKSANITSKSDGAFRFPNLQPGTYTLTVLSQGSPISKETT